MQTIESTGRIRITKVPDGEAPLVIREAWVGLVLPCDPYLGYPSGGFERGVLSKAEASCNRLGFSVPQNQALVILEQDRSEAAKWWREQGFPRAAQYFGFAEGEAEIVSGVVRQNIIEVTDEMMDNPNR